MADPQVRGIVHFIDETKSYGAKGFRKRLVVLEQDNERFTNYVPIEFVHEGCDSADQLSVGDDIEVTYRLSGRKWQKDPSAEVKYFLNAEGRSFEILSSKTGGATTATETSAAQVDPNAGFAEAAADESDIPF